MSTAPQPQMEVQDPVIVDPKHYKVELENEQVRVLRIVGDAENERPSWMHCNPLTVTLEVASSSLVPPPFFLKNLHRFTETP
jgi:hypothetical protein